MIELEMTEKEFNRWGTALVTYCLGFGIAVFLVLGSGCGGTDVGTNCEMIDNCGLDAGTTMPDTLDACADYRWMAEKPWDCSRDDIDHNFVCDLKILNLSSNGCNISCNEGSQQRFMFGPTDPSLSISKTPPPATFVYSNGGPEVNCTQRP